MTLDGATVFFASLIGLIAAAWLATEALARSLRPRGAVLALLGGLGATLAAAANDTVALATGLALTTLALALTPSPDGDDPHRAARRLRLAGATAAVGLYGAALLYAATATTAYEEVGRATGNPLYLAGLALLLAALALAAWCGHAALVEGGGIAVAGSMAALLRLVAATRNGEAALDWEVSLATLATIAIGGASLAAFADRRPERLFASAALSMTGWIAIAVAAGPSGAPAAAFALLAYALLTTAGLAARALLPGLRRSTALAAVALGCVGLPPTAGFPAKVYVLEVAVRAQLLWLVLLALLASAALAALGLRILTAARTQPASAAPPRLTTLLVVAALLAVVAVGVVPGPLLDAAQAIRLSP